jgi:glucose/arabinose dehydrogenase
MTRILVAMLVGIMVGTGAAHAESQNPGERFSIDPATLPPPHASPSINNPPDTVSRPANAGLNLPAGFVATLVTDDVPDARKMLVAPNGDILVARSRDGIVSVVRPDPEGKATQVFTFLKGMDRPYGLAFHGNDLYIADGRGVYRVGYSPGDTEAAGEPTQITPRGAFGDTGGPGGHWTRNLIFAPDGQHFFVAIGSKDNLAEEAPPRATIQEFAADGTGQHTFATGLRNPIGMAFYPGTSDLYAVVNERDTLGDMLPSDYLTRVQEGGFYGWPYSYIGHNPQPGDLGTKRPDLVAKAIVPDVLFAAHSAPLGLVIYNGTNFPAEYRGRAFVTMHGSWNRSDPTGYKVVSIPFENGRPKNEYYNFATGFRVDDGTASPAKVWGRPVGLAVANDGSLLISEDNAGSIWKVTYKGQ